MDTDYLTELSALYEISSIPTSFISHEELGQLVLDKATRLLGTSVALLYRREQDPSEPGHCEPLRLWAARGVPPVQADDPLPETADIVRKLDARQPLILEGAEAVRGLGLLPAHYSLRQGLCVPVWAEASPTALLCVFRLRDRPFTRTDLALFAALADRTGAALQSIRLLAEMEWRNRQLQEEIAERKSAEEALAHERDLFHALMDNLPDRIYFKDTQGRFTRVSKALADVHGLSDPVQAVGKTDFDFFTEEDARQFYEDEQEVRRSGQPSVGKEEREMWLDGRETWSLTSIVPLRDREGEIIGILGISNDITERKRAEEERERLLAQLSAKNRELDSFVYTVSHDLRSPLVSLQGFSARLLEGYSDRLDERGQLYVMRIRANTEHMGELLRDLLELSRIGRVTGPVQAVRLGEVVERLMQEWKPRLEERGVELEIAPDLPAVHGDRRRLEQVMDNLLGNAVKFMGQQPQPRVEVGWRDGGAAYDIYVRDNGIGIDPQYHDRIFEIFQRLGEVETEGTGVGLAIVKRIVEHHGGQVWVESERGQGATFHFSLPRDRAA